MEYNNETQHKMFGTWLKVTELKLDHDALSSRWISVCRILENIDYKKATFLVDYSFDLPFLSAQLEWLQEEFHSDDTMFIMQASDNPQELKNLVSVLLILLLEGIDPENEEFSPVIANYTLALSCADLRETGINNQAIIDSAKALIHKYSVNARERQNFTASEGKVWEQAKITDAIDSVDVSDNTTIQEALKIISNTAKNTIIAVKRNNINLSSDIKKIVKIQDEELNILWWLINSNSSICTCPFDELENTKKTLVLGLELAKLTTLAVEIPSAKVIFNKAKIDIDGTFTFSEFIDGIGQLDEILATIEEDIKVHTPILYALKNKTLDDCWFEECNPKIGVNNDKKISNIEWALQTYREILVINSMKEYI